MPKLTSLSAPASNNKENLVPAASSRSRKAKAVRDDIDGGDEEMAPPKRLGRTKNNIENDTASTSKSKTSKEPAEDSQRRLESSSSDPAPLKRRKETEEGHSSSDYEGKSRREHILEEKLALLTCERDQVQSQFDELREVRQTEPERLLSEWKKLADGRDRQAEEYITKLKMHIKSLESKKDVASSSSDGAFAKGGVRLDGNESWVGNEKKLKEEVARLTQELSTSSMALKNRVGSGTMGSSDEKAIRRLYEDLTGLVVNKVDLIRDKDKSNCRSYHAIFASAGYYNLEMKLEESESEVSSSATSRTRQDLIYVPALDPDRDAEILTSGHLPSYLKESLRFERSTAVRFMNTLHKKLDRQTKRGN